MTVANGAFAADFVHFGIDSILFILALILFLLRFCLKSVSKSSFFRFGVEIQFWSCKSQQFVEPLCVILLCLATRASVFADCSGMAASRFLAAAAASVILFCFASEGRKSHCNGCMKVANGALAADFVHFGIDAFPLKIVFEKCVNRRFSALASRSSFGAANRSNLWSRCA